MDFRSIDILQIINHAILNQGAAKNPNDKNEQEKLKKAAEDLCGATNAAASNALKKKLILRLEKAAKEAVASATQLISASKAAEPSNRNPSSQQQMDDSAKVAFFFFIFSLKFTVGDRTRHAKRDFSKPSSMKPYTLMQACPVKPYMSMQTKKNIDSPKLAKTESGCRVKLILFF